MLDHKASSQNEEHAKTDQWSIDENPKHVKKTLLIYLRLYISLVQCDHGYHPWTLLLM